MRSECLREPRHRDRRLRLPRGDPRARAPARRQGRRHACDEVLPVLPAEARERHLARHRVRDRHDPARRLRQDRRHDAPARRRSDRLPRVGRAGRGRARPRRGRCAHARVRPRQARARCERRRGHLARRVAAPARCARGGEPPGRSRTPGLVPQGARSARARLRPERVLAQADVAAPGRDLRRSGDELPRRDRDLVRLVRDRRAGAR